MTLISYHCRSRCTGPWMMTALLALPVSALTYDMEVTLEGGGDGDSVYSFAWLHFGMPGISYRF